MKLITSAELTSRSEGELRFLFGVVNQTLVRTKAESPERRNALASLASLENVSQALALKRL